MKMGNTPGLERTVPIIKAEKIFVTAIRIEVC